MPGRLREQRAGRGAPVASTGAAAAAIAVFAILTVRTTASVADTRSAPLANDETGVVAAPPAPGPAPSPAPPKPPHGSDGASPAASASADAASDLRPEPSATGPATSQRRRGLLRVLLGLALTVALAILGAHPRVRRLERRLGLTIAVASGLPFLLLGVVFQHPSVAVLDAHVLAEVAPFVEFGLGSLGFAMGFQLDIRRLEALPDRTGTAVACATVTASVVTAAMGAFTLFALKWTPGAARETWLRDSLLLGACAGLSAGTGRFAFARGTDVQTGRLVERIARLGDVIALAALLLIGAWFRPVASVRWMLPELAWLFVTLGVSTVLGILSYALLRGARSSKEELALTFGTIALSAGVSGRLAVSPLVVCAVAGALIGNLPRPRRDRLPATLHGLERPLFLLFMLIAGATAPFWAWQGWALGGVYALARAAGKLGGGRLVRAFGPEELRGVRGIELTLLAQSPVAIVTALAAATMYGVRSGEVLGWVFTAVVVGSYVNDVGVQLLAQRADASWAPPTSSDGGRESADSSMDAEGARPDEDLDARAIGPREPGRGVSP